MEQKTREGRDDGVARRNVAMEDKGEQEAAKARQRWRWKARARQGASPSSSSARSRRRPRKGSTNPHMGGMIPGYPENLPSFMPYYLPLMPPIPSPTAGSPVPWLVPPIPCAESKQKCSLEGEEHSLTSLIEGDAVATYQSENDSPIQSNNPSTGKGNSSASHLQLEQSDVEKCGHATEIHHTDLCPDVFTAGQSK